ncbi:MAG: hypothetical protein ACKOX6_18390 [Bdellovibrio sp.]
MKKIVLFVLLLSSMYANAQPAKAPLMKCHDNYFSNFIAQENDGKISLRFDAAGYADRLELAEKLGLPADKAFNRLDINVPKKNCSWMDGGRLSCIDSSATLIFRNFNGDVEAIASAGITLNTGEMGVGSSSYRKVELTVENDKVVTDSKGYLYCSGQLSR